ncbi:MAG: hypothetical protein MRY63_09585 [Neomegalonema sp.]|nr:hypothetical protein [Neomegalonema sp.]
MSGNLSPATLKRCGLLLVAGLLAGCATSGDPCAQRPEQDGIIGATGAVLTGRYTECNRQLEGELAAAQARAIELRAEARRLEAAADQLSGQAQSARRRLAESARGLNEANQRLQSVNAARDADKARLQSLRDREKALSEQLLTLSRGGASGLEGEVRALEEQQQVLMREIEQLEDSVRNSL